MRKILLAAALATLCHGAAQAQTYYYYGGQSPSGSVGSYGPYDDFVYDGFGRGGRMPEYGYGPDPYAQDMEQVRRRGHWQGARPNHGYGYFDGGRNEGFGPRRGYRPAEPGYGQADPWIQEEFARKRAREHKEMLKAQARQRREIAKEQARAVRRGEVIRIIQERESRPAARPQRPPRE